MHANPVRRLLAGAAVVVACTLAGCTQERALALRAAAERFSLQAAAAIDAAAELYVRGAFGPRQTDEVMLVRARNDLLEVQAKSPTDVDKQIAESFAWVSEREQFRRKALSQAGPLKQSYAEFALAFHRLPEGSLFAAKDVACAAGLGARLVRHMADAAQALARNPTPLVQELAASRVQVASAAADAVRTRNGLALDAPLRSHLAVLREQDRANAEVVAKLTDAAESGLVVLDMVARYDDVSVADLAAAVRQVLTIRESSFGLSSAAQLERLDKIVAGIQSKPALAEAATLPLNQQPAACAAGASS